MATVRKSPITMHSTIEIQCTLDAKDTSHQPGGIIAVGPFLLSTAHAN